MKRFLPALAIAAALCAACNKTYNPVAPDAPEGADTKEMAFVNEKGRVVLNGDNTHITFVGTKPGGKHEGGFKSVRGELVLIALTPGVTPPPEKRTSVQSIRVEIDTESLWADDEKLTQHLKGDDFFQAKEHPKIKFKSTTIVPIDAKSMDEMVATGDLTLRGVTKPITFPAKSFRKLGFYLTGAFKINRKDFGMTYVPPKGSIDDEVSVSVTVGRAPEAPKT